MPSLPPPPAGLLDQAALFLDFDGTLVEIAERPDAVIVEPALRALLPRLATALGGRLAIVSGRPIDEILAFLELDPDRPGIAIAGSHGVERLAADGTRHRPAPPERLTELFAALESGIEGLAGVSIERKPHGAVIHFRAAPHHAEAAATLAEDVARRFGLHVQPGKMVFELRAAGTDKGDAVRALAGGMANATPVFAGDDLTDEAGFAAAQEAGGAGILIGDRQPSAARFALPGVAALRDWLDTETKRQMND